jgi:F0F1-type ATP synthase delta subunit
MKYSIHDYAKALDAALADPKTDKSAIVKNFSALIRRNGDEARAKKILQEAARRSRGRNAMREVAVGSARALRTSQVDMVKKFLKPDDVVTYTIDADLIAGIRLVVNDEMQFDGTMKAKLDKLFGEQSS